MTSYAEVIPGDPICAITSGLPTIRELIGLVRTMFLVEIEWEAKTHLNPHVDLPLSPA